MIGIVGLGVIGGSYAMALKAAGLGPVAGMDVDRAALDQALAMGIIQQGGRPDKALLGQCHLVIIALYPALVPGFLAEHRDHFRENCLITDATGVKYQLSLKLEGLLRPDVDFVMGHPMAGREKMGLAFASAQVFQGANYILVPTPRNREENLRRVEALARALGFASVRRVDPQTHDQLIAYTSQLPHAMAVALMNSDRPGRETGRFIGDSYRDLTRIARINDKLWAELFLENKEALLEAMDRFTQQLALIRQAVAQEDEAALRGLMRKSTRRREALDP